MAKFFNPADATSVKVNISVAPVMKTSPNMDFLVRRVARSQRRNRRAL
ncbi:MAG: hypothetical protein JKX72_00495 [Robiginitomaculum sp.]|nr:hypothetical protein [Robiginitomaculum sp.]